MVKNQSLSWLGAWLFSAVTVFIGLTACDDEPSDGDGDGDADGDGDGDADGDGDGDGDADGDGDGDADGDGDGDADAGPTEPAVERGGTYFGFEERFNRYYTDSDWAPSTTIYVSPDGGGAGDSSSDPASVSSAMERVAPGTMIVFMTGTYDGCFEFESDRSGTYDDPIVLYGERDDDGSLGVRINCCDSGRRTCINLEDADYVAVDGFELVGERFGVRAVGGGYAANEHQVGVAVLNCHGHDQGGDPFFTGQSDWFVIENCLAHDVGDEDGHGIYLSNGSDWNIARYNETFNTSSSDFQINADPMSCCEDIGIEYSSPECDAEAGSHETGGRGASDYMLIEGNFFHHSDAQGPNFTSTRNSMIRNNIFVLPERHGASWWQETDNPNLGARDNIVLHNLFITTTNYRQAIGISRNSTNNRFINNIIANVTISEDSITGNDEGYLMETDETTVSSTHFENNIWISGQFASTDGSTPYDPSATDHREGDFEAAWFADFPTSVNRDPADFSPTDVAPWLDLGVLQSDCPIDREGTDRSDPADLGPFEY